MVDSDSSRQGRVLSFGKKCSHLLPLSTCALPLRQPLTLNLIFLQSSETTWERKSYFQMRLGGSCMKIIEYLTLPLSYVVVVKAIDAIDLVL